MEQYILVIDTTAYAGNFERQMTGYITGTHRENYHSFGYIEKVQEKQPLLKDYFGIWNRLLSEYVFDDEYGETSCGIMPTPGYTNNGMGKNNLVTETNPMKWPAYQSVGIALSDLPPPDSNAEFFRTVAKLANEFSQNWRDPFQILNLRLICNEVKEISHELEIYGWQT